MRSPRSLVTIVVALLFGASAAHAQSTSADAARDDAVEAMLARQRSEDARRNFEVLEQRQQAFERTLPSPERELLQPRLRELDLMRDRARDQLHALETETARDAPDPDRLRSQSEALSGELDRIERGYREMGSK